MKTILLIAAINACLWGQQPVTVASAAIPPESRFRKEYVVVPGDQLDVLVRRVPEATRTVVVRPDGQITLPFVSDVAVAGLTTREIDGKLRDLFSKRLLNPEVTVIESQPHPPTVYVEGEVTTPGAVPLRNAASAVQALALAGGLKRSASSRNIVLIRLADDGKLQTIPIDISGRGQKAVYEALARTRLISDDIIFVPESGRSEIARFIDDFVTRPLQGANAVLGTYVDFKLVQLLNKQLQ